MATIIRFTVAPERMEQVGAELLKLNLITMRVSEVKLPTRATQPELFRGRRYEMDIVSGSMFELVMESEFTDEALAAIPDDAKGVACLYVDAANKNRMDMRNKPYAASA